MKASTPDSDINIIIGHPFEKQAEPKYSACAWLYSSPRITGLARTCSVSDCTRARALAVGSASRKGEQRQRILLRREQLTLGHRV